VIVGFQEIVEIKASTLLGGGNSQASVKMWNDHVLKTLRERSGGQDYVQIANEFLVGNSIALFTKRSLSQSLTDIATSKVKLGMGGKVGNKGATLIRFLFEDTSFCFINCHLDSGSSVLDMRKRSQ
jgi:hypothetical protein